MPQTVKGVIARAKGAEVELVDVVVPDPGPGEAVVRVEACGVCHTDLHYREGGINDDFPFLLGHEAAGVVEAVGEGVSNVAPGDFVILNWRAVCGDCRACNRGEPWYCFATHNAAQKMTLEDGTELSPALGIGAFAEKTLVAAGQCTKVDPDVPAATAGLPPLLSLTFDTQAAMADDPALSAVRECTLSLDVPQVARGEQPFERLQQAAQMLAEQMDGLITDGSGQVLSTELMQQIGQDLQQLYDALDSRELSAGSPQARRLFS